MKTKVNYLGLCLTTLFLVSCNKDNNETLDNSLKYNVPETYTFDRNGATTIDFSGQSTRLLMLQEMGDYVKKQATDAANVDYKKLLDMYENTNQPFVNPELNKATDKQLANKTAASKDYFVLANGGGSVSEQSDERSFFKTTLTNFNIMGSSSIAASAGLGGMYKEDKRFYAANGLEPIQVVLKGLMGACFMDQVVNNYLSLSVLDEAQNRANNTNKVLEKDKNYTTMEHKWDEAYGYIYGADGKKFWASYIGQVAADPNFKNVQTDIELAFRKGRAAIVNNDYTTRDNQIAIIKENLAKVAAVRAVYYLKAGKLKLPTDDKGIKAFHDLSEGYGFIKALRYTNKPGTTEPYLSKQEVNTILTQLTAGKNGFWDVDYLDSKIDAIATQIASKFNFTVAQAENPKE